MSPETGILKKIICDHMKPNQLNPHAVDVIDAMILAFKSAV